MVELAWQGGSPGAIIAITGEAVVVVSDRPFAPGARPQGTLKSGSGREIRMKVHRCRKVDERFQIEGRLIDATRSLLDELAHALAVAPEGSASPGKITPS